MNEGCPDSPFYTGTFLTPSSSCGPTPVRALMRVLGNQARLTYWVGRSEVFQRRPRSEGPVGASVSLGGSVCLTLQRECGFNCQAAHSPPQLRSTTCVANSDGREALATPALARVPSADSAPTQTVGRLSRSSVRMHREVLYPHAARPGPLEVFPCDGGSSRANHF
jgi:hypothetical protein